MTQKELIDNRNGIIQKQIPAAAFMGVKLDSYDGQSVTMSAPAEANLNDKDTMFAGSISTIATLSGWSLLSLFLAERFGENNVFAVHSDLHYLTPLNDSLVAKVQLPSSDELERFNRVVAKKSKGKIKLFVKVYGVEANRDHQSVGAQGEVTYGVSLS